MISDILWALCPLFVPPVPVQIALFVQEELSGRYPLLLTDSRQTREEMAALALVLDQQYE